MTVPSSWALTMPHGVIIGQLVQHMRGSCPDIPIPIMTARADAVMAEFRERHRAEMLVKLDDLNSLVATVRLLIGCTPTG